LTKRGSSRRCNWPTVLRHFADPAGGFFFTADDHEPLIVRNKELLESSVPSGNSMAATALWRLGRLCGNASFWQPRTAVVRMSADMMLRAPTAMGQMLIAADMLVGPMREIVVLGDASQGDTARVLADLRRRYLPNHLVACRTPDRAGQPGALEKAFRGKTMLAAEPTVYICENFACQLPSPAQKAALRAWNELTP
jgi:uncharacterized protein